MSDPFIKLFWRLQNIQSEFSKLHTAVHRLRSFIDINIANYDSNGKLLPPAAFYRCPGTVLDKNMGRRYNWPRPQAITHAQNERTRFTTLFRSLTSAAWKIGFDIQGLKVALDISMNFPEPTRCEVIANNSIFSALDQQMEDVMLVYRYVKADMAGIPLSIVVKVPTVAEMDNRG